ncbi:MAG: aminopeptidase P family N-terminal domain-containing protein, partial [Chloroflexota bacterium]|nr:aminopeptidase P family N-terminal domain-containing protein [Chloroflexota bacterium]
MDVYETRLARLREAAAASELDLLVLYSDAQHCFAYAQATDGVRWTSGLKPLGPHSAVLLPRDDAPTIIVTPAWDWQRLHQRSRIERIIASDDFQATFAQEVREQKLAAARAGLTGVRRLTRPLREFFDGQFQSPPTNFDQTFEQLSKVRDDLELQLSERGAEIAER